jgi:hypothetical protein
MAKAKSQQPTAEWKSVFLTELERIPSVVGACRKAKISKSQAYQERKEDEAFAAAWEEALESGIEEAEGEVYRRGVLGRLEPVYQGGARVGYIRRYSDAMLTLYLRSHRPEMYSEKVRGEFTGPNGGPIRTENTSKPDLSKLSLDELLALRQMMSKAADVPTEPDTD